MSRWLCPSTRSPHQESSALATKVHRDSLKAFSGQLNPERWLNESRADGVRVVYQDEVHEGIQQAARKGGQFEPIDL